MMQDDDGFALLEAVVALGVLSLILGVAFQSLASARSMTAEAEGRRSAAYEARSLVDQLGATIPLVAGRSDGRWAGGPWRIEIANEGDAGLDDPMLHATVLVFDDRLRPLARLDTLRMPR